VAFWEIVISNYYRFKSLADDLIGTGRVDAISIFYVVCMFLLCRHLAHGVSSMFQTLGLRSDSWRKKLDFFAAAYGWVIFAGFSIIPVLVIAQKYGLVNCLDSCGTSCSVNL